MSVCDNLCTYVWRVCLRMSGVCVLVSVWFVGTIMCLLCVHVCGVYVYICVGYVCTFVRGLCVVCVYSCVGPICTEACVHYFGFMCTYIYMEYVGISLCGNIGLCIYLCGSCVYVYMCA